MSISGSCLPEPGKRTGKPLIALPGWPYGPKHRGFEITLRPRSHPTCIDEGTTVVTVSGMIFEILRVVLLLLPEIRYDG